MCMWSMWQVEDPECQQLSIQLMDEESFANAEFIGRATVPINNVRVPDSFWVKLFLWGFLVPVPKHLFMCLEYIIFMRFSFL